MSSSESLRVYACVFWWTYDPPKLQLNQHWHTLILKAWINLTDTEKDIQVNNYSADLSPAVYFCG